ncbi:Mg-chelatase subunit ChlD [Fusibacter tunisiensis]|uniref:Mg-chelatase subunit ChlD n=1 Tax=Fusibacter tunisiensis TaxID=1008308 RepID=A0ABS2MPU7_9FIRM|nr:Mg-chelatase subunit ChlD [Fusibacter tunisiensis]
MEVSEDDENTPSVWSFNTEVVSNWPNPVPKVNPLGEADSYSEIQYEANSYFQFNYYTNQLYAKTRNAYGNLWYLSIPKQENSEDPDYDFYIRDFKRYIVEIGGTIEGTHSYGVVFSIEDQNGAQHWGQLTDNSDSFRLDIISEASLRPGGTVDINPEDYPYNEATFMIYNPDTDFISAEIFLEGGTISLDIYQEFAFDAYKRDQVYSATLDSEIETYYRLNDLPLDEEVAVCKVSWNDSPEKLQFKLHALGDVTKIRGSEDLGAVIISAKEADGVAFFPDGKNTSIVHPEYAGAPIVDRTEEGDFLVYLPSGLWRAEITPKGKSLVNQYGTQLIPVQAGYQTRVELPYLLEKAFSIKDGADLSTEGLKIENIKELGDTVQFDFSLVDKRTEGIDPNMENTIVREGSDPVELVSITSVLTPPSVALLIDSSGSMKGQMEATLKAAQIFIEGLPEGTHLRVIDFDTEVRVFEGKTKAEGIQALKDISVGGYTALYDGILESIALIENLERATLVVFTDGTNELPDHKITPDMTSLDAVIAGLEASSVQLFGIGFGEGHDGAVLKTVSKIGGGQYFSAEDQNALSAVFTAINDKINATYTATYKRPTQVAPSDVPIVNIVVDISSSMDMEWDETTGHRMEKMKNLFHGFIAQLPDHTQIQIMSFNNEVYVNQLLTSDKLKALRALSLLQAGGGTNILDSVKVGYKTLAAIPSTQKVMVYLTDAALSVSDEDRAKFDTILDEIAEEGVNVLWLGLGEGLNEADYLSTAERSGGAYVISEDATIIKQSTDALLASMQTETQNSMSTVSIQVRKEEEDGLAAYFSASALAKLTPVKQVGKAELVDAVRYEIGAKLDQYDAKTSKFLSGDQLPKEAVKIQKRIDLNETRQNEAMAIHADELVFLGAFNGVQAPDEMRFAAVFLKLDHVLPKQEVIVYPDGSGHPANWVGSSAANGKKVDAEVPYVIPNVFNHFSLTYNNNSTHPVSPATWIAETPLVTPGETSVNLEPQSDLEGVLVFLVPKTGMSELSLHYYDTDYGHIHMPLVGEMALVPETLEDLPLDVGTDFHKGFKLMVDQTTGEASIGKHVNANDNNIFNVVRGRFQAMLQANLSLNPQERIHLISKTDQGDFYYPIHSATELLPYGMLAEQMVSPGAQNPVLFAFLMPEALENTGAEILVDLVNEDVRVPAKSGSIFSTGPALATSSHDYFDVKINQLGYSNGDIAEFGSDFIVLDISFFDHKDGFASRGVIDSFRLVHEGHQIQDLMEDPDLDQVIEKRLELALSSSGLSGFASPRLQENELVVGPSAYTSELVLGLDDDTIIYDGTARRGFVIFRVHPDTPYTLQSTLFEDLAVPVSKGEFDLSLLTRKAPYVYEDGYTQALSAAIEASILRYEAQKTDLSQAQLKAETLDPDSEAILDVDAPMMSLAGALKFKDVSTLDELRALLNTVSVVYDPQDYAENQALYTYAHSPEAILTQG